MGLHSGGIHKTIVDQSDDVNTTELGREAPPPQRYRARTHTARKDVSEDAHGPALVRFILISADEPCRP